MENYDSDILRNTAVTPAAIQIPSDEKEFCDEVDLQQLVMKLMDALSLQAQPGTTSLSYLDIVFSPSSNFLCKSLIVI